MSRRALVKASEHHVCAPHIAKLIPPGLALYTPTPTKRFAHVEASAVAEVPDASDLSAQTSPEPKVVLFPPSREQQVAIDALLYSDDNLIVDACAGSGKTTTILHLAQSAPGTRFLVLVYNRRLMLETEERVQALGLQNITVLNYHSLGARFYTAECGTDQGLKRVVEDDMSVMDNTELPDFSVLVMDEQQDMTPILKRFVDKVIRDKNFATNRNRSAAAKNKLRVVVLGDRRQEVYGFNNADSRFLTMASRPEVFGYINEHGWKSADQSTSNRITQQNVDFINQQMLKKPLGEAMRAVRNQKIDGSAYPKPRYVICDPYEDLLDEVSRLLGMGDLSPTDIIVLAPSVRGSSPAIYLANALALRGIPVFRSDSDVSDIAPEVAHGKVLICTYHQAKGIERKAAIVLGFDQNYHNWYDKVVAPPTSTSNPQYVATTRALEHLVVIHEYRSPPLPFVDLDTVNASCDFVVTRPIQIEEPRPRRAIQNFNVTGLCRNLSETLITDCLQRLEVRNLAGPAYGVSPSPPTEIRDKTGLLEGVSNVTGTAVPAIFQWRQRRRLGILSGPLKLLEPPKRQTRRPNPLRQLPKDFYEKIKDIKDAYDGDGPVGTDDILYLSALEMAAKDKDITKLLSIPLDEYTWLAEPHCRDIHYTLNNLPSPAKISGRGILFEAIRYRKFPTITHGGGPVNPEKKKGVIVAGAMDICRLQGTSKTVWEIKNSESLQPEHLLQVALYILLLGEPASGFLVSSRTGQAVQVLPRTPQSLMEILQLLVNAKSGGEQTRLLNTYSDDEFLEECGRNFGGLVGKCALPAWFAMKPTGSKYIGSYRGQTRRRRHSTEKEE
ncbi:hypothetical protein M406DRAFT_74629 [Cryphonectria parasitica EP155]|uniref:Helicase ATP-binding domain-containing protein n=1 Tax=Cryphonectria parasitica (strain ATCC 38755 / EP155) TaxID=660469 RepID=A0A9P4XW62_CRYP1|nr:uncharacterized protein M406DRAFT_74629 [Cryphonectria parasitica EP155]KAF3761685.1 hypothetical protein M406DRAFT_74629 [Cryphonectria parasitica EP155]